MSNDFSPIYSNFKFYFNDKAGLEEDILCSLEPYFHSRKVKKGEILLREGEIGNTIFFVEKGLLRAYTIDDTGKEHVIQFAPENWIVSERGSIFFNEPSQMFIDAIEDAEIMELKAEFIQNALASSANFRTFHEKLVHNHIRHLQQRINSLLSDTAEKRYLAFIKTYPDILLRVPQWMVASYLGITPEGLSRVRKELAHKNFKTS